MRHDKKIGNQSLLHRHLLGIVRHMHGSFGLLQSEDNIGSHRIHSKSIVLVLGRFNLFPMWRFLPLDRESARLYGVEMKARMAWK